MLDIANPIYQLGVDVNSQLTVVQVSCENQQMVDMTPEQIRAVFSERLNMAADAAMWDQRGRAPRLQKLLKNNGINISVQGVTKWFNGNGLPDRYHMAVVAGIFGVSPSDLEHNDSPLVVDQQALDDAENSIIIRQYDTGGRGGPGIVLRDQPGIIQTLKVDKDWLRANLPHYTNANALAIVTGFGDSMPQVYSPGDPVLVDTGVTTCDHDGIYFFRIGEEGFIKRLQRIPGQGIRVLSQNPEYEAWTITPGMDFAVMGKVLRAWMGKNY